ncbi:tigger transposable element-derived protein 6-like [Homalodisca vitripennis]|uniref:tigger transposable element-derived protein 6-like n=1 Tax=Homalodisca vitripennis TaxID=197043 RepID=UPI001EE9F8A5|nr:tigger transposable element-derived protein 6-like [Homalodisca vitripennis]
MCKKAKKGELQDVEEAIIKWLKQCRDKNVPVGGPILQEKPQQFAEQLGHADFRASNGWLDRFKKRHEISFKKICGESVAVNVVTCEDWKAKLPDLIRGYNADDIYNADETGLVFKCLPDKTLTFKRDPCNRGKNSQDRLTVLLCNSSSGTDKLKPLVIGKSNKPRCFKNVSTLPTDFKANNKVWINREVFDGWLKQTNEKETHSFIYQQLHCTCKYYGTNEYQSSVPASKHNVYTLTT